MFAFKRGLIAVGTTASLFAAVAGPALADTFITISGNGNNSTSDVAVNKTSTEVISQNNTSTVTNVVEQTANSGGNTANNNTGPGGSNIDTGNASATANITNQGSTNTVHGCGCEEGFVDVLVEGNGNNSNQTATLSISRTRQVIQTNNRDLVNDIRQRARTGRNRTNNNTGNGTHNISTGNATESVTVNNTGDHNTVTASPSPSPIASF